MICYSHIIELKFLFERAGLFPSMRINQELNILSNGQILTMNQDQKDFIETLAHKDHVEKDVIVTGPVGSGKTLLGLEAITMKKSYYKEKYGLSFIACHSQLRVIILIGSRDYESNVLKQQLDQDPLLRTNCSLEIETIYPDSANLTSIFQANANYKSFLHTLIMMDEIAR